MLVVFGSPQGHAASPAHYRARSVVQALNLQHQFLAIEVDLHIVSKARNIILDLLPQEAEVLWMVDGDVRLPPHAGRLLDFVSDENPVVSGLYFHRRHPHFPQVYYRAVPDRFAYLPLVQIPGGPFYADSVGAGCLVIKISALREMAARHAEWVATVQEWREQWLAGRTYDEVTRAVDRALAFGSSMTPHFEFLETVGEDFYFCESLRYYLGKRPLVVPEVECIHEGMMEVGRVHFEAVLAAGLSYAHNAVDLFQEGEYHENLVHAPDCGEAVAGVNDLRAGTGWQRILCGLSGEGTGPPGP